MGLIALFDTIYESHCTISTNFYLFQLTFTFIYSNFSKKFPVSTKQADRKQIGPQDAAGMSQKSGDLLICQLFLAQASYFANSNLMEMKSQIYFHLQFKVVFL